MIYKFSEVKGNTLNNLRSNTNLNLLVAESFIMTKFPSFIFDY